MDEQLEARLRVALDRQEIEHVLKLYCRAIDRCDLELLKTIYHPDGTDDHGSFSGNAMEFAETIIPSLREGILDGMHTVTHCTIDVEGDFATSESYYWAYQQAPGGEEAVTAFFGPDYAAKAKAEGTIDGKHDYYCGGRYIDLFERRDGQWKILRRKITNEWNDIRPSTRITDAGHVAHYNLPGRRDRQDPVYLNHLPDRVPA
ncbi:SnoaL-like domain-containing protein [Sphingobium sp. AP50]|uniref:nuclear transport factor 2 family protein n=1 Tax=Sphingobium sp. AP50 TaxID=1884369 RepID=UPI0008BBD506|nr:nuclear transport factor 2 family protein [Sphingobium sp. AP50]SEJ17510.1 SnoaL-like domain-containing protein [Sphingobium sp. AP50]